MAVLLCPLCSQSRFETLEALRGRLIRAATQNLLCPICSESLMGLDKFTIHLFGHSLPPQEQPSPPEPPPPPSTVNIQHLSCLTSWNPPPPQANDSKNNQVLDLLLEIKPSNDVEDSSTFEDQDTQEESNTCLDNITTAPRSPQKIGISFDTHNKSTFLENTFHSCSNDKNLSYTEIVKTQLAEISLKGDHDFHTKNEASIYDQPPPARSKREEKSLISDCQLKVGNGFEDTPPFFEPGFHPCKLETQYLQSDPSQEQTSFSNSTFLIETPSFFDEGITIPKYSNPSFNTPRQKDSPTAESPPFTFDPDSLLLTPSPGEHESSDDRSKQEVKQLSHDMAGILTIQPNTNPQTEKNNFERFLEQAERLAGLSNQNIDGNPTRADQRMETGSSSQLRNVRILRQEEMKDVDTIKEPLTMIAEWIQKRRKYENHLRPYQTPEEQPSVADPEAHSCPVCGKTFRMRGSVVVHARVAHGGKELDVTPEPRNYHCALCPKAFKKEQHLGQHMKTHDGKQWKCDICSKLFTTKYFLKKHQRLHTGEMPYCCETCGKTFTFQQSYHKHLLYHSADKPHECLECGRSFKELSTLHNHQRIHSGEKPFGCEVCGKSFRQRVSYIVHQRIHTGVLPYQCTACLKKFRYKVSQRSHKCTVQPPGIVVRQPTTLIEKLLEQRRLLQCPR